MSFLDDLESEARRKREADERLAREREAKLENYRRVIVPAMARITEYLKKVAEHLNYLEKQPELYYSIPVYGKVQARWGGDLRTNVSKEKDEYFRVQLLGTAVIDRQREVSVTEHGVINRMQQFLVDHGLTGNRDLRRNQAGHIIAANYQVEGSVQIRMALSASIDEPHITVELVNLDDYRRTTRSLEPERVDDALLDRLGRYVARVDDAFLREDLPDDVREQLRAKLAEEEAERQRAEAEMAERIAREEAEEAARRQRLPDRLKGLLQRKP